MMRNFVRDVGNQVTLGVFVGSFTYSVLALGSITFYSHGTFVPHLSITVAEAMLLLDVVVLVYFIDHIAATIQLPEVIASIARDLESSIDTEFPIVDTVDASTPAARLDSSMSPEPTELLAMIDARGGMVIAAKSGYLQFVGYAQLAKIAKLVDAVIRLDYRPGHFIVAGRPVAKVFPEERPNRWKKLSQGSRDRTAPDPHARPRFRHRSISGDRHPSPLARRERHVHGTYVSRLALFGAQSYIQSKPHRTRLPR